MLEIGSIVPKTSTLVVIRALNCSNNPLTTLSVDPPNLT